MIKFPSLEEMIFRSQNQFQNNNNNQNSTSSSFLFSSPQIVSRRRADLQAERTVLVHVLDHNLHIAKTKMQRENALIALLKRQQQEKKEQEEKQQQEQIRKKNQQIVIDANSVMSNQSLDVLAATTIGVDNDNTNNKSGRGRRADSPKKARLTSFILDTNYAEEKKQERKWNKSKLNRNDDDDDDDDDNDQHKQDQVEDQKQNETKLTNRNAATTIVISSSNLSVMKSQPEIVVRDALDFANDYLNKIGLPLEK